MPAGLSVATEEWSPPEKYDEEGVVCNVYLGKAFVKATVDIAPTVPAGQTLTLAAQPSWLLCATSCQPGQGEVSISLPVGASIVAASGSASSGSASSDVTATGATATVDTIYATPGPDATLASADSVPLSATGLLSALGGAFLGGLLLNFMPCVFPVLSLKALELVRSSQQDQGSQRRQSLYYALGVVVSFWLVAAGLTLLRAMGFRFGWGFQMQSTYFVIAVAFLFVALALNLFGVYEIGLGLTRLGQEEEGGRSAWLSGVLAVVVATPCTAPFMGAALGVAFTLPLVYGWLIFTALGIGLAVPLVGLAWFPRWQRALPRPGVWMVILRQVLAFPLLLTAVYFSWIADVQAGPYVAALMVAGWVLLGAAAWLYGQWERRHSWIILVLAVVLALIGLGMPCVKYLHQQVNLIEVGNAPGRYVALSANGSAEEKGAPLLEAPWSPAAVQEALADGHPVFIDFGAAWCLTCQVNEQMVLHNAAVQQAMRENEVVFLKADWTNRNAEITQALEEYGRSGVPLYVYYAGHLDAKPQILPEILSTELVLNVVNSEEMDR